jgi:hypothetical protein
MIENAKIYTGKEVERFFDHPATMADRLGHVVSISDLHPNITTTIQKEWNDIDYYYKICNIIKSDLDLDIKDLTGNELANIEIDLFKKMIYNGIEELIKRIDHPHDFMIQINLKNAGIKFWYNPDEMTNSQSITFGFSTAIEEPTKYWEQTEDYENYMDGKES